jgi:COMPASS component SPP1
MPGSHDTDKAADKKTNEDSEEDPVIDDKLYCICKTKYDEDRVMIACDR